MTMTTEEMLKRTPPWGKTELVELISSHPTRDGSEVAGWLEESDIERLADRILEMRSFSAQADVQPIPDDHRATEDMTLARNVREATIAECEQIARGPVYAEIYNGCEGHNWSRDSDYGRGRHMAADAILALSAQSVPPPQAAMREALGKARSYVELIARNQKYPLAIETLNVIDAALSGTELASEDDK